MLLKELGVINKLHYILLIIFSFLYSELQLNPQINYKYISDGAEISHLSDPIHFITLGASGNYINNNLSIESSFLNNIYIGLSHRPNFF